MAHQHKINNLDNSQQVNITIEYPDTCPICHKSINPVYIAGHMEANSCAAITFLCRGCNRAFLTRYHVSALVGSYYHESKELESLPECFEEEKFPDNINKLSPNFSKIYNQALQAETLKLDEICGMGYRKALEFLIKDYCLYLNPDDSEKIKSISLKACIDNYFDNRRLKHLAEVSAFIGNEETHYQKQYDWGTIGDMKQFISALVQFVSSDITAAEAYKRLDEKFNHSQN